MRNMVRILTVGALVGWLSGGLAYAADVAGAKFEVIATQKVVQPGAEFTVEVRIEDAPGLGAYQFMIKVGGGAQASLTVTNITANKNQPDYVLGAAQTIEAFDAQQNRYGGATLGGGTDVVSGTVATVSLRAPTKEGTYTVNVAAGIETFLRDADGVPMAVTIGKDVTITVSNRATPLKRKRTGR